MAETSLILSGLDVTKVMVESFNLLLLIAGEGGRSKAGILDRIGKALMQSQSVVQKVGRASKNF